MITIGDIMIKDVVTISPAASVARAAELMEKFKVGGLPVIDGDKIIGIITSRDIRRAHQNRLVADAMTRKVVTAPPETSLWEAKELIEEHGVERLLVAKDGKLLGIVTKSLIYIESGKHIDPLTGLPRSEFLRHIALKLLQEGNEISVIFIDLDNFGTIDKEIGHESGDQVLKQVAKIFKDMVIEGSDYLCRYAGDEFALITTRPLEEAKKLCFRLLRSLTNHPWPNGTRLTASAGVAGGRRGHPRPGSKCCTVHELINLASLGSTQAKKENTPVVVVGQVEIAKDTTCTS
ncbi:MAG: GGDEF domain-containing protein [Bacillota bacterium]